MPRRSFTRNIPAFRKDHALNHPRRTLRESIGALLLLLALPILSGCPSAGGGSSSGAPGTPSVALAIIPEVEALPEDAEIGRFVASFTAEVSDGTAPILTLTPEGAPFAINFDAQELVVSQALDFEQIATYELTLTAAHEDDPENTAQQTLTVTVTNVPDVDLTETLQGPQDPSVIAENTPSGTEVASITAEAPQGQTLRYAIDEVTSTKNGEALETLDAPQYFAITTAADGRTGLITTGETPLDFETADLHRLVVSATAEPDGSSASIAVMVRVENVPDLQFSAGFTADGDVPLATIPIFHVAENSGSGEAVLELAVAEIPGQTFTYAIESVVATKDDELLTTPGGWFVIDPNTGAVTTGSTPLDFEAAESYLIMFRITAAPDGSFARGTIGVDGEIASPENLPSVYVIATDVEDVQVSVTADLASVTLAENPAEGVALSSVTATAIDGQDLTYRISDVSASKGGTSVTPDANWFAINSETGAVTTGSATLDFETADEYTVTVIAEAQPDGSSASVTVMVRVENVPDLQFSAGFTADGDQSFADVPVFYVAENSDSGEAVLELAVAEIPGQTFTYAIEGVYPEGEDTLPASGGLFVIDPNTGAVTTGSTPLDFETVEGLILIRFRITASPDGSVARGTIGVDGRLANPAHLPFAYVKVTDVEDVLVSVTADPASVTLAENPAEDVALSRVTATPIDGQSLAYRISDVSASKSGTSVTPDADWFAIDPATGAVTTGSATLDFETADEYTVTVIAEAQPDGGSSAATLIVALTNVPDITLVPAATPATLLLTATPAKDAVLSTLATTATTGSIAGQTLSYALEVRSTLAGASVTPDADWFAIDSASGEITAGSAPLSSTQADSHTLEVTVTASPDGSQASVTVTVIDVTLTSAAANVTVDENTADATVLSTVSQAAPPGKTLSYSGSVSSSKDGEAVADLGWLALDADSTLHTTAVPLDFEAADAHQVEVTVTVSPDSLQATVTIAVTVRDIQDGTDGEPYLVSTLAALQSIASGFRSEYITEHCAEIADCSANVLAKEASVAASYLQAADIDASSTAADAESGFLPIGEAALPFSGRFDGAGYSIDGLYIDRTGEDAGLFAVLGSTGELLRVGLRQLYVRGSGSGMSVGGLVGSSAGSVADSFTIGTVYGGTAKASGGLVGSNSGTIANSFSAGLVEGQTNSGGLVGENEGSITASFSSSAVDGGRSADAHTGGLVGLLKAGEARHVFAQGDVLGQGMSNLGGLAGGLSSGASLTDSFASGLVSSSDSAGSGNIGGLVGENEGSLARAHWVSEDTTLAAVGSGSGSPVSASRLTPSGLKALSCASTTFRDADGNACSDTSFPWNFGEADAWPVLNQTIGGWLTLAGQRTLLDTDFSALAKEGYERRQLSIDASSSVTGNAGNTLVYSWHWTPAVTQVELGNAQQEISFLTPPFSYYLLTLTVSELDSAGERIALHSDSLRLRSIERLEVATLAELQSIATGFSNTYVTDNCTTIDADPDLSCSGGKLSVESSLSAFYKLIADIDASSTADASYDADDEGNLSTAGEGFLPIGDCGRENDGSRTAVSFCGEGLSEESLFLGAFDGQGFAISDLHIARSTENNIGLFVLGAGAIVERLELRSPTIKGLDYVGALAAYNTGTVRESHVVGGEVAATVDKGEGKAVGGLVGRNGNSRGEGVEGVIESSSASASVIGDETVGGLVGWNAIGSIRTSHASGPVAASGNIAGGLVGQNGHTGTVGIIEDSFATGDVSGKSSVGGLVGIASRGSVSASFATGKVRSLAGADASIGGLVGAQNNDHSILLSFATGDVEGTESGSVGGLLGRHQGYVREAFATGDVSGILNVGGLVGWAQGNDSVLDVYATGDVSGDLAVGGVVGTFAGNKPNEHLRGYWNKNNGAASAVSGLSADSADPSLSDPFVASSIEGLRALTCGGTNASVFRWNDPNDSPDAGNLTCSSAGAANFPWDFGSNDELPVFNGLIGGVLDAAGQRALLNSDFSSLATHGAAGEDVSVDASTAFTLPAGHTLTYFWAPPAGVEVTISADGSTITISAATGGDYAVGLTIIERDANGQIVGVYEDEVEFLFEDGSASGPYLVQTLAELQSIATGFSSATVTTPLGLTDSLAAHYRLGANIDASSTANADYDGDGLGDRSADGEGFLPIGNSDAPFNGSFDGATFAISGLHIERSTTDDVGLFGELSSTAEVFEVLLVGGYVRGANRVGSLAGSNAGTIRDSFSSAIVFADAQGASAVGGLIGSNSGTVSGNIAVGHVEAGSSSVNGDRIGGLVGENSGTLEANFANSRVIGDGSGTTSVGGLVGQNAGTIKNSFVAGGFDAKTSDTTAGNPDTTLVFNKGSAQTSNTGGLVGLNSSGGTIDDVYAAAKVEASHRGALVGSNDGTLARAYWTPNAGITGASDLAAFVSPSGGTETNLVELAIGYDDDNDNLAVNGFKALKCDTPPIFLSSDDKDCKAKGSSLFPWDFGYPFEWPVLNRTMAGVLGVEAQRALLDADFIGLNQAGQTSASFTLNATLGDSSSIETIDHNLSSQKLTLLSETNTLDHFWSLPPGVSFASGYTATDAEVTVETGDTAGKYILVLTIVERDANARIMRIYAGPIEINKE